MTVIINEAAFLQSVKIGGKRQFCSEGKSDQKRKLFSWSTGTFIFLIKSGNLNF